MIPIHSANPGQIDRALMDIHKQCAAKLKEIEPGKQLQLLIIILPDLTGSYGEQLNQYSDFIIRIGFFCLK